MFVLSIIFTYVVPIPTAVILLSSTVTTSVSNDSYVKSNVNSLLIKFIPYSNFGSIYFVSPAFKFSAVSSVVNL